MNKEELKNLSTEKLLEKEKGTKTLIGIFIVLILALGFFVFREYFTGTDNSSTGIIIWICTVGGLTATFPELKAIREELKNRE